MQALAERLANQEKVKAATQRAFIAQTELEAVRARFAAALQELDQLGEAHTWLRESFGLTASELRQLLALDTDSIHDEDDAEDQLDGDEDTTTSDTNENAKGRATETTRSSTAKILPPPTTTSDAINTTRTRQAQLPPEPPPTRGRLAAVRGGHLLFNRR